MLSKAHEFLQIWRGGNDAASKKGSSTAQSADRIGVSRMIPERDAVRFLHHATTGFQPEEIRSVQQLGYSRWIDMQMAMPSQPYHVARQYWSNCTKRYGGNPYGWGQGDRFITKFTDPHSDLGRALWWRLLSPPDTLRQRVALALSEILVISFPQLKDTGCYWPYLASAKYFDLLADHAFGNYRDLLGKVALHPAMATFLTVIGSRKARPGSPATPDENFARELIQLFTVGKFMLNPDGTTMFEKSPTFQNTPSGQVITDQRPIEAYTLEDVKQLARIFTGLKYPANIHQQNHNPATDRMPPWLSTPLAIDGANHDSGECTFLNKSVAAGNNVMARISAALNIVFNHRNVGPFISKQLIQRLVTSNPSPAYVKRVADIFNDNGQGERGNLGAVIKAILLDPEARDVRSLHERYGKVREPILRLTCWARLFQAKSANAQGQLNDTWMPSAPGLGQMPLAAPSVFNFFRPDYIPNHQKMSANGVVAPEMEIAGEQAVVNYVNGMEAAVYGMGIEDMRVTYAALLQKIPGTDNYLADNAAELVKTLSLWLTAGEFLPWANGTGTIAAIDRMPRGSDVARLARVQAAIFMTTVSSDFIVQK